VESFWIVFETTRLKSFLCRSLLKFTHLSPNFETNYDMNEVTDCEINITYDK
jgi:hypothetical protein